MSVSTRLFVRYAAICVALAVIIFSNTFFYNREVTDGIAGLSATGQFVARSVVSTGDTTDRFLTLARSSLLSGPDDWRSWNKEEGHLFLLSRSSGLEQIEFLTMYDEFGTQQHSSLTAAARSVLTGDRNYFKELSRGVDLVHFGPSINRVTNVNTYSLIRRLPKADGSFGGYMIGTLSSAYINNLCKSSLNEFAREIAIVGKTGVMLTGCSTAKDGTVVLQAPQIKAILSPLLAADGTPLSPNQQGSNALFTGLTHTSKYFMATHDVQGYNLVVVAYTDWYSAMGVWVERLALDFITAAALIVILFSPTGGGGNNGRGNGERRPQMPRGNVATTYMGRPRRRN